MKPSCIPTLLAAQLFNLTVHEPIYPLCLCSLRWVSVLAPKGLSYTILKKYKLVGLEGMNLNTVIFPGPASGGREAAIPASLFLARHLQGAQPQNQVQHQEEKHQPTHTLALPDHTLPTDRKSRAASPSPHGVPQPPPSLNAMISTVPGAATSGALD